MYLTLVYARLLASVFVGECLHLYHFIGCALIPDGIYLTTSGHCHAARAQVWL